MQFELVPMESSRDDQGQFHLSDVATDAAAWPVAERDEGVLLLLGEVVPAVGDEIVSIVAPDLMRVVNGVGRDGEHGVGREVMA